MGNSNFNENTRVQVPAALHLCKLGYIYLDNICAYDTKSDFYRIMRELAEKGIGVILCSSDMMEIIGMSDRVLVMYEGGISAELKGKDINEETIMRCAMGLSS